MLIHKWDAATDDDEWRAFLATHAFGDLVAGGRDRDVPVVVPTQFVMIDGHVLVHLIRRNPIFDAIRENDRVVLSVAGDWSYIPSSWKTTGDEDPRFGIPTTYYAAVQLTGRAQICEESEEVAEVLRTQLAHLQPDEAVVDPSEHGARLQAISGLRIEITDVRAKFKYGGNVDQAHREAVFAHLQERDGPGDAAAAAHLRAASGCAASRASSRATSSTRVDQALARTARRVSPWQWSASSPCCARASKRPCSHRRATEESGRDVLIGGFIGLALAATAAYLVYWGGRSLPLRLFFKVTGVVLIVFAAGLLARTVLYLQISRRPRLVQHERRVRPAQLCVAQLHERGRQVPRRHDRVGPAAFDRTDRRVVRLSHPGHLLFLRRVDPRLRPGRRPRPERRNPSPDRLVLRAGRTAAWTMRTFSIGSSL